MDSVIHWSDMQINRLVHDILNVDKLFPPEEVELAECGIE
jgi:hypothetical protein